MKMCWSTLGLFTHSVRKLSIETILKEKNGMIRQLTHLPAGLF